MESRSLAALNPQPEKWKYEFWDPMSTEPAMIRFPLILLFYLFLWGVNLFFLDQCHLQYYGVLGVKNGQTSFVLYSAIFFSILYTVYLILVHGIFDIATETTLVGFYALVFFLSLSFFPGGENRSHFFRILKQIFFPGVSISFPEILVADALCSLSKPFKDLGLTMVIFYSHVIQNGRNPVFYHNTGMIIIALFASLPFVLRIRQCLVQYYSVTDISLRIPITLNIIKYFSSFPPIWLAALASFGYFHPSLPALTAVMATINSVYSFLWDIVMDWGLLTLYYSPLPNATPPSPGHFRARTVFSFPMHLFVACFNLFLRFSWAANRIEGLSSLPPSQLILLIELAEVLRRAVWNVFRIEWEINQQEKNAQLKSTSKL